MKKLFIVIFSTTVFITAIFGSVFSQDKLFLCRAGELGIYLDNNFEWDQAKDEAIFNLFEKFRNNNQASEVFFNEFRSEFKQFTELKPGDKLYVSTDLGIFETKVIGYVIESDANINFYTVLSKPDNIYFNSETYYTKYYLCSQNEIKNTINYEEEKDDIIRNKISNTLKKYDSKIKKNSEFETEKVIKIFKGSFVNKGETEYAVSYVYRISFDSYASGIFIFDNNGNILIDVFGFTPEDFNFTELEGIVDYNDDGLNELLLNIGYYEGYSLHIFKYEKDKFVIVTSGFNIGV